MSLEVVGGVYVGGPFCENCGTHQSTPVFQGDPLSSGRRLLACHGRAQRWAMGSPATTVWSTEILWKSFLASGEGCRDEMRPFFTSFAEWFSEIDLLVVKATERLSMPELPPPNVRAGPGILEDCVGCLRRFATARVRVAYEMPRI